MNLLHVHLYKTIKEAKTAIKQYFKVHYFIRLIRPRRIKKINRNRPARRIKKIVLVGNRPRRINKNYSLGLPTNNDDLN